MIHLSLSQRRRCSSGESPQLRGLSWSMSFRFVRHVDIQLWQTLLDAVQSNMFPSGFPGPASRSRHASGMKNFWKWSIGHINGSRSRWYVA